MKTAARIAASFIGIFAIFILILTCYYYYKLPDKFYVNEKSQLTLSSYFDVRPVFKPGSNNADLRLFGVVPIKSVTTQKVDAPLLVPGGEPFGIKLISDGVMVVDLASGASPAKDCGIKEGDIILSVNGVEVSSNADISKLIRNCDGQTVKLVIRRDGEKKTVKLTPEVVDGSYRAGMWVRDSSAGIGTVTFYSSDGIFGGLGHPVCDVDTGDTVPIKEGEAADVSIHSFQKSENGNPGALLGGFTNKGSIGEIYANKENGVFGRLTSFDTSKQAIPLGFRQEIKKGDATILTTIDGTTPCEYKISIEEIRLDGSDTKNLVIKVTDEKLLRKTGGILQGMSGSPIIQNGKLVGAVTHVFVNDVTMGYGVFADEMYNTALSNANDAQLSPAA